MKLQKNKKKFKIPPKRFQPKGLTVLFEDHDILVVDKTNGLLTVSTDKVKENTAYYLLNDYVKKGNRKSNNRVFIVHRLDRETSGVLVFAKNEKAKYFLQDNWKNFHKQYSAVICGTLPEKEGVLSSYLAENSIHKMYSVSNPEKGKFAKTGYKVIKESAKYSMLEVDLMTGRKNQIRVHFAEQGFAIAGDKKYGQKAGGVKRLALHAESISMVHPFTKEEMTFTAKIPGYFYSLVTD